MKLHCRTCKDQARYVSVETQESMLYLNSRGEYTGEQCGDSETISYRFMCARSGAGLSETGGFADEALYAHYNVVE